MWVVDVGPGPIHTPSAELSFGGLKFLVGVEISLGMSNTYTLMREFWRAREIIFSVGAETLLPFSR